MQHYNDKYEFKSLQMQQYNNNNNCTLQGHHTNNNKTATNKQIKQTNKQQQQQQQQQINNTMVFGIKCNHIFLKLIRRYCVGWGVLVFILVLLEVFAFLIT